MNLTLKEICEKQEDFDKTAIKGRVLQKINGSNLHELEHLIVCLLGELGEFSNITKNC